jgi:hypothetical protein
MLSWPASMHECGDCKNDQVPSGVVHLLSSSLCRNVTSVEEGLCKLAVEGGEGEESVIDSVASG